MFDPNFNPLEQLEKLEQMNQRLVKAHADNCRLLQQLVEHVNQLTDARNNHDLQINHIHNRLTLLEVARQYETDQTQNKNDTIRQ